MKKELKILLFIIIGCVICVLGYGAIRIFNQWAKVGKYNPKYIYENAYEYIDPNASDIEQLQFSFAAESDGDLYYIDVYDNLLYKKSSSGQDTTTSSCQMNQMILIDNYIIFNNNQELSIQNRENNEVLEISSLYDNTVSQVTYVNGAVLYINDKAQLCSCNIDNQQSKILSENTYSFKVYGSFIFYEVSIDDFFDSGCYDGIYGMGIDGENQNRITDVRGIRDYEIYRNMIFIASDRNAIFKIDMENSSYSVFPASVEALLGIDLVNEKVYYSADEDFDEDGSFESMFIATDLDGNVVSQIKEMGNRDRCWAEFNDENVFLILVSDKSDSFVYILDKAGNTKKVVFYGNGYIQEFVCLSDYIVVRTKENDGVITYLYDFEYELLSKF